MSSLEILLAHSGYLVRGDEATLVMTAVFAGLFGCGVRKHCRNGDHWAGGVADAVMADGARQVGPRPDGFTGADDQQASMRAEAHQYIAYVSLGELEYRSRWGAGVVEDPMDSSPVRLGDILLRYA